MCRVAEVLSVDTTPSHWMVAFQKGSIDSSIGSALGYQVDGLPDLWRRDDTPTGKTLVHIEKDQVVKI